MRYSHSFSVNEAGSYDWSEFCNLSNETSFISPQIFITSKLPNPFNPTTLIKYDLPGHTLVVMDIYDARGRKIKTLFIASKLLDIIQLFGMQPTKPENWFQQECIFTE